MIDLGIYKNTDFNNLILALSVLMSVSGMVLFGYWTDKYSSVGEQLNEPNEFIETKNDYYISGIVLMSLGIVGIFFNTIASHEDNDIKSL